MLTISLCLKVQTTFVPISVEPLNIFALGCFVEEITEIWIFSFRIEHGGLWWACLSQTSEVWIATLAFSVWRLQVLPMRQWGFPCYPGFFPQAINMHVCLSESLHEVGLLYSWNLASFSFQQRINIRRENLVNAKSFNWGDVCAPSSGQISVHFIEYIELICSQGGFDPLTCWFWNVLRNQPEIPGEKTCKLQTGRSETVRQLVITTRLSCCLYSELQYCADYSSSVLL